MPRIALAFLAISLPITALAEPFEARNRLMVMPTGPSSMEVVEQADSGLDEVWCAAAQYVEERLGNPMRAILYLISPQGPSKTTPGRNAVGFTIKPSAEMAAKPQSNSETLTEVGTNVSVEFASSNCRELGRDQ